MPILDRPGLTGAAWTYPPGTAIAFHAHPAGQLIHAISGSMRVSVQGMLWVLPIGRALWIPPDVEHAIWCGGEVQMRTAYVSPACLSTPSGLQLISVSALAREVLVRLSESTEDVLHPILGVLLLHEIAAGSIRPFCLPIPFEPRLTRLVEALRADPASGETIGDWAKKLGFSERSLIRRIRDETGMTFRELRRHTRIMTAIERLGKSRSVTGVAYDVGFGTPSSFIHAFRTVTGKTPRQFMSGT